MKNHNIVFVFFIAITSFRTHNSNMNKSNDTEKPFCGIMNYDVDNNTPSGGTIGTLYVSYPGIPTSFTVNYSSGQSGNVGSINTGGPAGTLFSMRLSVTGERDVVRLYRAGILLQTIWGAPTGGFYYFYNVPSACAVFSIVVE